VSKLTDHRPEHQHLVEVASRFQSIMALIKPLNSVRDIFKSVQPNQGTS
jgi:hypothetical protein